MSTSSITEKKYLDITPKSFTADGTDTGILTISSTYRFKVGMLVSVQSGAQPVLRVKIQRVISDTQFIVIKDSEAVTTRNKLDMSMYLLADTATVAFTEDKRPVIDILEIQRQVYEEEPTVALRHHSVDWLGRSYSESNPVPIAITASTQTVITNNLLAMQAAAISPNGFLRNNDGFFIFDNTGNFIKV